MPLRAGSISPRLRDFASSSRAATPSTPVLAAGIAINVVLPASTSFGGVAPILIYSVRDNKVHSISGLGRWPAEASAAFFLEQRGGKMAPGVERIASCPRPPTPG